MSTKIDEMEMMERQLMSAIRECDKELNQMELEETNAMKAGVEVRWIINNLTTNESVKDIKNAIQKIKKVQKILKQSINPAEASKRAKKIENLERQIVECHNKIGTLCDLIEEVRSESGISDQLMEVNGELLAERKECEMALSNIIDEAKNLRAKKMAQVENFERLITIKERLKKEISVASDRKSLQEEYIAELTKPKRVKKFN